MHQSGVAGDEVLVPIWILAARDHGDRLAAVESLLPVGEVNDCAEVVPCEDACHAGADVKRVKGLDVLVGFLVDGEEILSFGREESRMVFWVEGRECDRKRETLRQDRVAGPDDLSRDDGFVLLYEGLGGAVEPLEPEEVARTKICEYVEQEFRG